MTLTFALSVDAALCRRWRSVAAPSLLGFFFSPGVDAVDLLGLLLPVRPFGTVHAAAGFLLVWIVYLFSSFGWDLSFGDWGFFLATRRS